MNFLKRIFGSVEAAARPLAQQMIKAALQQAVSDVKARTAAKYDPMYASVVNVALDELAREIEAAVSK